MRDFVAGHVRLGNNLAEIERERQEAEKAAREEAKKKQKTVGNGVKKAAEPSIPPLAKKPEPEPLAAMSLFDQAEPTPAAPASAEVVPQVNSH